MKIAGVAVGVLMVGGALIFLTRNASAQDASPVRGCMNPKAMNYNKNATIDNGTCVFEDKDDKDDYDQDKQEEEERRREEEARAAAEAEKARIDAIKNSAACRGLYGITGERTGNSPQQILSLSKTISDVNCDVNRVMAVIYTDKSKYIKGEKIHIWIGKKYHTEGKWHEDDKWEMWCASTAVHGHEEVNFEISVIADDDTLSLYGSPDDGYDGLAQFLDSTACGVRANGVYLGKNKSPAMIKRIYDDWGWSTLQIDTGNLNISEGTPFTIKARVAREKKVRWGYLANDCSEVSKKGTKTSAITVYPSQCKITTASAEDQSAPIQNTVQNAEGSHDLTTSFNSYINTWM